MLDRSDLFLAKALASLAGAESELANRRYDNCVSRSYYATFQAAIAALHRADVRPPGGGDWSHSFVASQFDGILINRRKLYPAELRGAVSDNHLMRLRADYSDMPVSRTDANRSLRLTRAIVSAVQDQEGMAR
jgi:uncharacterized protein (UPF0332 family)